MRHTKRCLAGAAALVCAAYTTVSLAGAPAIDPANDADHFGPPQELLFWSAAQKVAGFRNMDRIAWTRPIAAGKTPLPLPRGPLDLGTVSFTYEGTTMTVDDYMDSQSVVGLLVIKDGTTVYERYRLGNTAESRWVSFSVTKSVVSMLIGAAIKDGYIDSVDEKVGDYLPRLKGTPYEQVSIRDLLQMASGVDWNEDYADPDSDIATLDMSTLGTYAHLNRKDPVARPGERFNYNTAETNLAGTLLRAAIGNNLSTYLEEKIWRPFGMEHHAHWMLSEPGGGEIGGCCISATLRDYGRIGLFALNNGVLADGTAVLPDGWMAESTAPSNGAGHYGYLWWLGDDGAFQATGIFGQSIFIDPEDNIVIAVQSAQEQASNQSRWGLMDAFFMAIVKAVTDQATAD